MPANNRDRVRARTIAVCAAAMVLARASEGSAYCRTSVCPGGVSGTRCTPAQEGDCGTPLRWAQGCFGFSVQVEASTQVDLETSEQLLASAFGAWLAADCGGGTRPGLSIYNIGPVICDQKEYNQAAGNANLVVYRDDLWPYQGAGNTLALTTVTYNLDDGAIFDADLEINATVNLTTGDEEVEFDLSSILTHETGHMIGLAHSADTAATMFIQYTPGDTALRSLHTDDLAAVCAAYPPGQLACEPTPRHGFASECDPAANGEPGCACSTGSSGGSLNAWLAALGLLTAGVWRQRQRQ
jgi:MYXO-CTERM domain-containing protein